MALVNIQKHLRYDKDTGIFIWSKRTGGQTKTGDIAGTITTAGYICIKYKKKQYLAHRLAFYFVYGYMPSFIDHKDLDKTNNRILNLREVSQKENALNRPMDKRNKSGCVGVCWCKQTKRWKAAIVLDGKNKTLGRFIDFSDAVNSRKNAEVLYGFYENNKRGGLTC